MKTNAQKKIYIRPLPNHTNGYVGVAWDEPHKTMVEYTRTDAFIEKACEFLSKSSNYNEGFIYPSHSGVIDAFVNNFKNYMRGE